MQVPPDACVGLWRSGVRAGEWSSGPGASSSIGRGRVICCRSRRLTGTDVFAAALTGIEDAFWAESFEVAPVETAGAVERALVGVLSATEPGGDLSRLKIEGLAERPNRHLKDLVRLVKVLDGRLPSELASIRALLAAPREDALHTMQVLRVDGVPVLTRWQDALVQTLNRDSGDAVADGALSGILEEVLAGRGNSSASGALGVLQSQLFQPSDQKPSLDDSVQWLGVRDFLQEAEVAAGMVQTLLAENKDLSPADIGLLVPDRFEYALAVEDAFRLGGLALSGLPVERWRRDLGREAVFHFLYCRQKPAPAMALAVCLSSPLMPWSIEDGAVLAQAVMDGDYELKPPYGVSPEARVMLDLLREGDSEPATLDRALAAFAAGLDGGEAFEGHVQQARAAVDLVRGMLADASEIHWAALRRAATPRLVTSGATPEFSREGLTVWRESQEPWRPVKRLIVLGFAQGQYPASLSSNPVFSAEDLKAIRKSLGLPVVTPADELKLRRERFRRQLGAVSESVTFLVPRRDFAGEAQAPSESLVFMHQLFAGPEEAEGLVIELDAAEDRARVRGVALARSEAPRPPRVLAVEDLSFGRDLLTLRVGEDGQPKPESPSSLETLMVSGLAWLLRRLEAEPIAWAPEATSPMLLGTIAHRVFEGLFAPELDLPMRAEIPGRVDALLDEALRSLAPFLRSSHWNVERRNFAALTTRAALAWCDALERLGAEVVAAEAWLQGQWCGIAIHGQTDLILGLPGDRLLVVDYKRSKSKGRLTQMQKGYDSQASLYRAMLETGGPKDPGQEALISRLRTASQTGVVYYLLNDQVALADTVLSGAAAVPGWRTLENDIAGGALGLIEARIGEIRSGTVRLNREGDRDFFDKQAGLKPYALEMSPLIEIFVLPDEGAERL